MNYTNLPQMVSLGALRAASILANEGCFDRWVGMEGDERIKHAARIIEWCLQTDRAQRTGEAEAERLLKGGE